MYKKKESKKKTSSSLQTDCKESQSFARREDKETGKVSKSWNQGSLRCSYDYHATSSSHEAFTSDTSSNDDIPDESQQQMMFLGDVPAACLVSAISKYALSPRELFEHGYPLESLRFPGYARINNITYPSGPKVESDSGQYSNSSSSDNSESSSDNEKNFDSPDKKKGPDDQDSSENEERCDSESSSDNEKSLDDKKSSGHEQSCDSESSCDSGSNSGSEKSSESKKSCNRKGSSNSKNCSDGETRLDKRRLEKEKSRDNDSSSDSERSPDSKKKFGVGSNTRSLERTCVRCEKIFYVDWNGEYLNAERCIYHCGKLHNRMTTDSWYYTCCNQSRFSRGCAEWKTHVWTGLVPGINESLAGYVYTMPSPIYRHDNNYGIYAMDCEMCFTVQGLELARVTLVNLYGQIEYDTLVQPSSEVIDYNTKFSGITEDHMSSNITKTLPEVQNDLLNFIYTETILMGHGLGNDLRALRLVHRNVIDTSVMFPHYLGLPYRNGLKTLARRVLNRKIQEETHNSIEDAQVVMDLVMRKVKYEWQTLLSGR